VTIVLLVNIVSEEHVVPIVEVRVRGGWITLYKQVVKNVVSSAADTYLLKLQSLQNKVLRTNGNSPRCAPVHDLHMAFNLFYVYNYITKLCRQQAEVIQNHENEHVLSIGQGEARHRK
jgi:hypothetical protein